MCTYAWPFAILIDSPPTLNPLRNILCIRPIATKCTELCSLLLCRELAERGGGTAAGWNWMIYSRTVKIIGSQAIRSSDSTGPIRVVIAPLWLGVYNWKWNPLCRTGNLPNNGAPPTTIRSPSEAVSRPILCGQSNRGICLNRESTGGVYLIEI